MVCTELQMSITVASLFLQDYFPTVHQRIDLTLTFLFNVGSAQSNAS